MYNQQQNEDQIILERLHLLTIRFLRPRRFNSTFVDCS